MPTKEEDEAAKKIQNQMRKNLTMRSNKRQYVAFELKETEQFYVDCLRNLLKNYIEPMRNPQQNEVFFSPDKIKTLFAGLDPVLAHHEEILSQLSNKLESWTPTTRIGDIFENIAETVGKAYAQFTKHFSKATLIIQYHEQRNSRFREYLEAKRVESGSRYTFQDLLIMPIQRFPHYILILERLSKLTPDNHPDSSPLKTSIESVKKIAELINTKQIEAESYQRLKVLEGQMSGTCPPLAIGNRKYIREMVVTMLVDGLRELRHLVLLSDSLLCLSRTTTFFQRNTQYNFNWMYPLQDVILIIS